jgi:homoserine kinase type II
MAVYTDVSDADVRQFLAQYDVGEAISCKGIAEGVENSNFLLVTERGPFILTLYEKRVEADDLPFFLDLMRHLQQAGINCPQPVPGRDGAALRRLCGRPAAIVTFLPGMWPRKITPSHCAETGAALARLHEAGRGFTDMRANALSLEGWQRLFAACADHADKVAPRLRQKLADELDFLCHRWPRHLPGGIIHADLFPDNVFFQDGRLSGIIDFYFACHDTLTYDLAICLNAWCFETDGSFNVTKGQALLRRYDAIRPLSAAEWDALPILARGAALRFLLTRLYDWLNAPPDALVTRKNPLEYLDKLAFHQTVPDSRSYGAQG